MRNLQEIENNIISTKKEIVSLSDGLAALKAANTDDDYARASLKALNRKLEGLEKEKAAVLETDHLKSDPRIVVENFGRDEVGWFNTFTDVARVTGKTSSGTNFISAFIVDNEHVGLGRTLAWLENIDRKTIEKVEILDIHKDSFEEYDFKSNYAYKNACKKFEEMKEQEK